MGVDFPQRRSVRLSGYNYSQNGAYFITICAKDRDCLFGQIVGGEMVLSELGNVIQKEWEQLSNRFTNIEMDEFVIMPNHMQGIVVINNPDKTHCGRENLAPTLGNILAYFKYQSTKRINHAVGAGSSRPSYIKI